MFETMAAQVLADHFYGHNFVPAQGDFRYPRLLSAGRRPHKTLDGHVCCLVYTDSQWRGFLQRIGNGDLFDADPRFAMLASRTAHIDALYGLVSDEIATRTTAQLQELLAGTDIPIFPMHTFETLIEDEHLHDIGFFREVQHPVLGMLRQTAVPSEWHGTPPAPTRPVPLLGEHTADVLREVGYDDNAIAKLMAARAAPQFPAAAATPKAAGSAISETSDTHASP
jgi:crotonobetainyl-CoA:carnitine CoA-transferase CaiB-like acyl-CoA transferase